MDDVKRIAEGLHPTDREWLWMMPCDARRCYPLAFIRNGLVESRRRWWIFGPWTAFLNDRGQAVRAYLEKTDG